ncbi:anaphase-promoting complex subunit 4-like [Curcuma longa]|uniref:anaphase-promoting complex subunit 4-like n=1 Tax=Curcuma longa TaxID=136217 RepID=UPI003D9E2EE5
MYGYIEKLGSFGFVMDHELSNDLILYSLPESYSHFMMNYRINRIESTIPELINMLKSIEPTAKKEKKDVMLVDSSNKGSKRKPAVEIIGFRIAELRGLSRWRARYRVIGLDEKLIDNATEKAGMLLVQVERFSRILAIVLHLLQNFFNWVLRSIKILMSEPVDQVQSANSELIVVFLKFVLNHDPVGELLDATKTIDVDGEIMERLEELVIFGGYSDTKYLERNLLNEFNQMEQWF